MSFSSLPVRFRREEALRALLLLVYAGLLWRMFPLWELATDDGKTLMAAEDLLRAPAFFGPTSSVGVLHPPYIYLYQAAFLGIFGSLAWVQAGITLGHLASHWLLIGLGKRMFSTPVAYAASLLAFTSPNFLFLYHQRFWEPVLLPPLTMLALLSLLRFRREGKAAFLALSLAAIILASGAHFTSLCFLLIAGLAVAARGGGKSLSARAGLGCLALLFLALFPILHDLFLERPPLFALLLAATLAGAALVWRAPKWLEEKNALLVGLSALCLCLLVYLVRAPKSDPATALVKLLDPLGGEAYRYHGLMASVPQWALFLFPLLLIVFLVSQLRGRLMPECRLFIAWLCLGYLPIFAFAPISVTLPGHWLGFLFPALWLACAQGLFGFPWRKLGRMAAIAPFVIAGALIVVQAQRSLTLRAHVEATGGIGMHSANLSVKEAVVAKIFRDSPSPELRLLVNPWHHLWELDLYGWAYLMRRARREFPAAGAPKRAFYIYEPFTGVFDVSLVKELKEEPGSREEAVGPVMLYSTERVLERSGLRVPERLQVTIHELR